MAILQAILARKTKIHVAAKKISAARVIYESQEVQRVEVRIELPEKEILVLELTAMQTKDIATQLVACLQAMGYDFRVRR